MHQDTLFNQKDKQINKPSAVQDEDELDDLDDLLDEFADDILSKQPGSTINTENRDKNSTTKQSTTSNTTQKPEKDNIDELIKDLNIEDPETKKQFEELVQQFSAENDAENDGSTKDFDDVMKDTMKRLKNSGKDIDEQLRNGPGGDENLISQLLSGLGGNGDLNMSDLLVDMLEQLSSKDVLYEPIKELNTKFPQYLEENKGVITDEQHSKYSKQYGLTCEILEIFNAPDYSDEDKTKKESINTLLESLQELGQPPSELVGDADDFLGLGGAGSSLDNLDFDDKDLPQDLEKQLEENCKQS